MTKEEAIEWFYNSPAYHGGHEPFNIAIECIQHCIDEEDSPCWECDDKHYNWVCQCGIFHQGDSLPKYCSECGRKIDFVGFEWIDE